MIIKEIFDFIFTLCSYHKDIVLILGVVLLIILGVINIILLFVDYKRIRITAWTYIGALIYPLLFILLLFVIRIINVNTVLDLKEFYQFCLTIELSILNFFLLLVIVSLVIRIASLFSMIQKCLILQVWKVFIYYRHKYFYNEEYDNYHLPDALAIFIRRLTYDNFCFKVTITLAPLAKKFKIKKLDHFFNYSQNLRPVFIILASIFLLLLIIYELFFNNMVLQYTKYYLIFFAIFGLWYKISLFLRHQDIFIDRTLYERTYLFPKIIYVNIPPVAEYIMQIYISDPNLARRESVKYSVEAGYFNDLYRFIRISSENYKTFDTDNPNFIELPEEPFLYINQTLNITGYTLNQTFFPKYLERDEDNKCFVKEKHLMKN